MQINFDDDHRELLAFAEDRARTLEEEAVLTRRKHLGIVLKKLRIDGSLQIVMSDQGYPLGVVLPDVEPAAAPTPPPPCPPGKDCGCSGAPPEPVTEALERVEAEPLGLEDLRAAADG